MLLLLLVYQLVLKYISVNLETYIGLSIVGRNINVNFENSYFI